jgi:hypothetical protein
MKKSLLTIVLASPLVLQAADWPQYRGASGDGEEGGGGVKQKPK